MKKREIIIIAIVSLVAGLYGFTKASLNSLFGPPMGSQQALREELTAMNLRLPMTIDADTVLDHTSTGDHVVSFNYKIVTRTAAEVESEPFVARVRERLVSASCTDRDLMKRFLSKDTTVQHSFRGKDNVPIATIAVTPQDCANK